MTFQLIISFLTLLLFIAAIIAPLVYTLYKQKQDREENARRDTAANRGEKETGKLDPSPRESTGESYHRYSGGKGYRVENRPSRVDGAGREVYSTPYSTAVPAQKGGNEPRDKNRSRDEKSESLSAHTKEFSSHSLSSSLDERYNGWDEMSRNADSWNKPAAPFGGKTASTSGKQSSTPSSMTAASTALKSGEQTSTGLRRIRSLPELKRALVMSQILGPPKALELEHHPGYGKYQ